MKGAEFANPEYLWLFLLLPVMAAIHWKIRTRRRTDVRVPDISTLSNYRPTLRQRIGWLPILCRFLAVAMIIFALARPRSSSKGSNVTSEGIAIVLAMDVSTSMLAEDLRPNRIEAAKEVAAEFISGRPNDLIGMVIFSGESFTQCPITSDHSVLLNLMDDIKSGVLEDGTAIGEGLATAISRIKDSKAKSKVIILLTDGVNNKGQVSPATAGEIAKTFGIRVYTIGVGRNGTAPYPFQTPFGVQYQNVPVEIDETTMQQISDATDGQYFRATNNNKLKDIYAEIDKMEKTKVEVTEFRRYTEEYFPLALLAAAFFILEITLRLTLLRSLP
ncbi:MAG: VWA domain-containing protein [Bacteroidota bacterium]|nr:VWA domain-containing protein [Bacteroidota bacterium]